MSDALPLPPRPSLEQYKKFAKDFQHACKASDRGAIREWAARWTETLARPQGLEINSEVRRQIDIEPERMEQRWQKFKKTNERAPDGGSAVNGCLHNGRKEAAEFFASHGARLDLEGAAAVGRLDVVKSFFNDDGTLKPPATQKQMKDGFAWACEFGRTSVVALLLQRGMEVDAKLRHHGQTGLHWAAYGGWADTVKLLLEHGVPIDAKDEAFGGTPLEWALYQWGNSPYWAERGSYYEVVALLARAGAKLDPQWCEDDEARQRAAEKMRSDPRMLEALRGELPPE